MSKAGYCKECKKNVWIREDGSCQFGHPPSAIVYTYDTDKGTAKTVREQKIAEKKPQLRYSASLAEWSACPRCNSNRVIKRMGAGQGGIQTYLAFIFVPLFLCFVFSFVNIYLGLAIAGITALLLGITLPMSGWYCRDCKAIWRTEKDKEKYSQAK